MSLMEICKIQKEATSEYKGGNSATLHEMEEKSGEDDVIM